MLIKENFDALETVAEADFTVERTSLVKTNTDELVTMLKLKSEMAFNILYDNYCCALYSILLKLVNRKDVADDLLQEVFLKIWKNINAYDPERGTLFTWMLNIARNRAIDYLRSTGHRQQQHTLGEEALSFCRDYVSAYQSNFNQAECKEVAGKARQLDPKYAIVIDLIFFYGCTHEQTARILQLPLGTIKTRARKAISLIKVLYGE